VKQRCYFLSASYVGTGLSGGDRILVEFLRFWGKTFQRYVVATEDFFILLKKEKIEVEKGLVLLSQKTYDIDSFIGRIRYVFERLREGVKWQKKHYTYEEGDIFYSSSDFWPDFLPTLLMKLRNPKLIWIAGFYLFAPKPWDKNSPYKGKHFIKGLFYYLTQLPAYFFIKRYADIVFVTSEPDKGRFVTKKRPSERVMVIQGFVCMHEIRPLLEKFRDEPKEFDGCFMARLHYQKGCLELLLIWKRVLEKKPNARLAIIGDGPLREEMEKRVKELGMEKNVKFFGTLLGEEKYRIFARSRVMLHPATYDSGGMAMAEGMAFGLPGVSFDLEALKTYYPRGVMKTPCYDLDAFAGNVLRLLEDETLYQHLSNEAKNLVDTVWDSEKRNEKILEEVLSVMKTIF